MHLRANTAVDVLIGPFVDSTDGDSEETGLTLSQADIKLSKNGQALAQKNDATAAVHDANGYYNCELDATDTNTEGNLVLIVHESGALHVRHEYDVLSEAAWDSLYVAKDDGFMDVNIKTIGRSDTQETEVNNFETACANYSATRGLTGTALPAAAADAAGGVPISDAGGLDLDGVLSGNTPQTADHTAAIADIPTVAEFNARTLVAADYFDPAADTVATVTSVTNGVTLANDAITAATYDETTAFPVVSADSGATQIARTGIDGDTLETISDEIATAQTDLDTLTGADGATLATVQGNYAPAKAGNEMALINDAITSSKYDETTAYPVTSADSGATQIARTGIDGDTLETISDEIATAQTDLDTLTGADGATLATVQGNYAPAKAGNEMALINDAITSSKYDETTAFPVVSADSGATQIARTGIDGDTLETISDEIAGLENLSAADVNAQCDAAIETYGLDHLVAVADADDPVNNSIIAKLAASDGDWSGFDPATDSQEAIRDEGDASWGAGSTNPNVLLAAEIATVTTQTEFTLATGSDEDDAYNDQAIVLYDDTNSDYPSVRVINDYVGGTKTVTIDSAPDFTLGADDSVRIFVTAPGTTAPTAAQIVDEWETQSQADPTGFHVNVQEVGGTAQTANDNGADINAIVVSTAGLAGHAMRGTDSAATAADLATAQADLDTLTGADGVTLATSQPNYAPATAANLTTVDTVVDAIKAVTDNLPDSGALTSLATAAAVATVDTVVDGIATEIGTAGDGLTDVGGMSAAMKTQINAEVVDALGTDTIADLSNGAPPSTPTITQAIMYLYSALVNRIDVEKTLQFKEFHNASGTLIWKKAISDDDTTYIEAKGVAGS